MKWGRVLDALAGTGLVAMPGSSVVVNATAFTLGGGQLLVLARARPRVELAPGDRALTADGRHRWLRDADEPELLWASRGAGGAFGVVTAIEVDLHPAPVITGGRLVFAADGCRGGASARSSTPVATPPTRSPCTRASCGSPTCRRRRPSCAGRRFVTAEFVELGASDEARAAIDRVRASGTVITDTIGPVSVEQLGGIAEEPTDPSPDFGWSTLADLDGEAIDRLLAAWQSPEGQPVMGFGFRVLGGALASPPTRPGIAGAVREAHVVSGHAMGVPGGEEAARRAFEALHAALGIARIRSHLLHLPPPGVGLHRRVRRVRRGTRREREGHRRPRGPVPRQSRLLVTRRAGALALR